MPTDYDKIREENIREYGEGTRHLSFLGRLYTDRTHFVFELLQNAEDAGATRILFNLCDDRLEVLHDGRRFNEQDVRGVCGVGEGTKTEDLTQIGKFGIGFKSVYAYTDTPEVHSGNEGFRIEHYVRPHAMARKQVDNSWTTLFVFPFNSGKIAPEKAVKEIGARLRNLSGRTLLFLREINEIEYSLPNSTGGAYLREEFSRGSARQIRVIGQDKGHDQEEDWLVFERGVPVPGSTEIVRVEVSFRLEAEEKSSNDAERIVKVRDSPIVVFFPTEKATRFGFLIQGPYRTTPSRDNIPNDDDWNATLVRETAELIGDVLFEIKDLGLLSVSFLDTLPIRTEDFPADSMLYPIVEAIRNRLMNEPLLPADDGSFVPARNAKLARGNDLRRLLNEVQLGQLYQSTNTLKWLTKDITEDRTPDLHKFLLNELDVEEVRPEALAQRISHDFLSVQPDKWFVDFYTFLTTQETLWKPLRWKRDSGGVLRSKPILRLSDGSQAPPFKPDGRTPNAYLPPPEETDFPVVCRSIVADEQARTFLERLGLAEPDVFDDIVEKVLPKYVDIDTNSVSDTEHQADIRKIVRALCSDSESGKSKLFEAAKRTPFLKATDPAGGTSFRKPTEIYLNTPELRRYFTGVPYVWFLHDEYATFRLDIDVWDELGVSDLPRVIRSKTNVEYSKRLVSEGNSHSIENRGLHGLENALKQIQASSSFSEQRNQCILIWQLLIRVLEGTPKLFLAEYTWQYYRSKTKNIDSNVIELLRRWAWIPTQKDTIEKPGDITTDQLIDEFLDASELIEKLGIGESAIQSAEALRHEHATKLGVSVEDIEFVREHPKEIEQLKNEVAARKERPLFPSKPVANLNRRQECVSERVTDATDKEYEKHERSVRTTTSAIDPTTWLRNQYTNEADQMVCQICKEEMPFRKRDGAHYFEKKEVLSKEYLPKELEAQYLALCPLCAAKYDEFVKTSAEAMAELRKEILNSEDGEIPIILGDEQTSIRFVETHYHDLRQILAETE